MSRVTVWTRNPWGAFLAKMAELGIYHTPWFNERMMVEPKPVDGRWIMRYESFGNELRDVADQFPMGSTNYPMLILDWELWFKYHSAERIAQMQELIIRATNFFDQRVKVAFYGLPCHKRMWAPGAILDRLYQPVIDMQGALCVCLYSRGSGSKWFDQDVAAYRRLLNHARNIAADRPIMAVVQGRRDRKQGWGRIDDDDLMALFGLIAGYDAEINVFGGLRALQVTRNGATSGKWTIDPAVIPTDEEYGKEQANVLAIAHKVMAA